MKYENAHYLKDLLDLDELITLYTILKNIDYVD